MEFKLNIKQEMKLILTQEMQTSINILQLSSTALKDLIKKESKENPAIEVVYSGNHYNSKNDDNEVSPLDFIAEEKTLTDILEEQIGYLSITPKMKYICEFIVNNLDSRGYLALPKEEITTILKINKLILKEAFSYIHTLDPSGVGAENLQECLKIQLRRKEIKIPFIYEIIDFHLEDLARKNFDFIAEKLHLTVDEVKSALKEIQKLSPIPARGYNTTPSSNFVIPDVTIYTDEDKLVFKINEELMPKVYINSCYKPDNDKEKAYIERAMCIKKSIEKRYETLTRIMNIIIEKQKEYFLKGKFFLKTLTIKEVAHILELHDSTISRAIKDKYIDSPQGIVSMRALFILDDSVIRIKQIIEDSIENEDKEKPFSDNSLEKILKKNGFKIARRTIAKYREEIGYPSSRDRKKQLL